MKPWTNKSIFFGVTGVFLLITGIALFFSWPLVFDSILRKELPLTPTSRSFEIWKDSEKIPMNIDFYFFNWTNPKELRIPGSKPNFIQMGPYSFKEKRQKVNITFHPENSTVSYFQKKFWYFDPDRSNGTLNDIIVNLNPVAVSASHKVRYWSLLMQNSLSMILSKSSQIYTVKTVGELLFVGYSDTLIEMASIAVDDDEEVPPFDKFGWFYMRNGSTMFDGYYNMATGEDNLNNLGMVKFWNHRDTTNFYKSPCNVVEGSAGEFWPPHRNTDDITIWTPDLCRPIIYEYTKTVSHQGIAGYKYELGEKTLGNSTKRRYPHEHAKYFERTTTTEDFFSAEHTTGNNKNDEDPDIVNIGQCYCNGECSPMGVINITSCRYGAPGFVSLPHFHKADPIYREQISGMNPNDEDHSFYVTLEPTTGIPLDVAARFQINMLLQPSPTVSLFHNVPKIYFPMFWFSLRGGTTEELSWQLSQLLLVPNYGLYGSIIIGIVGALMLVIVALIQFFQRGRSSTMGKMRIIGTSNGKKSELVYMDTTVTSDDHERNDRQLYCKD
ncbi:protein croquemort-like [Chelonus insularis]|uniref:protein croquemort-like n=1 Tax=Chelonus insularis TaxID=460826 RepID=UPI00158E210D|nr:protein croquemort-like [Chelonus insularis]XP_034950868.1 protein croquemort-like [Chelonus insularis]XP_034950869.1 protein croquemort-like [Chelonus insularis]XP_034950870.1 protein croquemort-like [Chelonus insularis]